MTRKANWLGGLGLAAFLAVAPAFAAEARPLIEPPLLAERVAAGKLPPIAERLPSDPHVTEVSAPYQTGRHGGDINMLIGRAKDVRLLVVYGYARLVGYDRDFNLKPDILQAVEVEGGRVFTLKLRPGHKWSDGHPFTSEDFRYYWEDVANNRELSPTGPPRVLLLDGEAPKVEVIDETTVRYGWSKPNPYFLARLAGASPLFIYRPAHYLKPYHTKYAAPEDLAKRIKKARVRSWAPLHNRLDNLYKFDNPALPTLQPWRNVTRPPATRFTAERNPYFHRIDQDGRQLPYADRFVLTQAAAALIPAKAGAGEVTVQARGLAFKEYPFLKQNEKRADYRTLLWQTAKGSHFALFPNLNHGDPAWRDLFRDVRFRRALSLAIDRDGINESIYYGTAETGNNGVLSGSAIFDEERQKLWAEYDPDQADELLDEIGLTERDDDDIRLLPDGRPCEIVVETAGEDSEQVDILELVRENWAEVGVKLFTKPSQREVFRNRIFSGETQMSVWFGFENGVPTPEMSPAELAPTTQQGLQWPKWGQFYETSGQAGEPPDLPEAKELLALNQEWLTAGSERRTEIWERMLALHAEQQFTIGVVAGVKQPVVVKHGLKNVPEKGVYNWDPGAQLGIHRPDLFWLAKE